MEFAYVRRDYLNQFWISSKTHSIYKSIFHLSVSFCFRISKRTKSEAWKLELSIFPSFPCFLVYLMCYLFFVTFFFFWKIVSHSILFLNYVIVKSLCKWFVLSWAQSTCFFLEISFSFQKQIESLNSTCSHQSLNWINWVKSLDWINWV